MALWEAVEDADSAADLTGVLCLVGSVFALFVALCGELLESGPASGRLAVDGTGHERMSAVYRYPLYLTMVGFSCCFWRFC